MAFHRRFSRRAVVLRVVHKIASRVPEGWMSIVITMTAAAATARAMDPVALEARVGRLAGVLVLRFCPPFIFDAFFRHLPSVW